MEIDSFSPPPYIEESKKRKRSSSSSSDDENTIMSSSTPSSNNVSSSNSCVPGISVTEERKLLSEIRSFPLKINPYTLLSNGLNAEEFCVQYVIGNRNKRKLSIFVSNTKRRQKAEMIKQQLKQEHAFM